MMKPVTRKYSEASVSRDITTALETLYAHTNNVDLSGYDSYERAEYYREVRAALSTIEAELRNGTHHVVYGNGGGMTVGCDDYATYVEGEAAHLRAERDEAVAALREAWDLFGEADTIAPENLRDDDYFDRWCIRVKALLGLSTPKEPEYGCAYNGTVGD